MRVQVTRDTVAGGCAVFVGQVVDLPDEDAAVLLRLGKATALTIDPPPIPKDPAEGPAPVPMSEPVAVIDGKPAQKRRR